MAAQHQPSQTSQGPLAKDSGATEWLYDTLDEPLSPPPAPRRRWLLWPILALFLGLAAVAFLVWLLIGPSPLVRPLAPEVGDSTATPFVVPTSEPSPVSAVLTVSTPVSTPLATTTGPSLFEIGDRVVVTGTGTRGIRVRSGSGLNFVTLEIFQDGDTFFLMPSDEPADDYPVLNDGYRWWRLRSPDGLVGWAAEDFLLPAPLLPATPEATATQAP